MKKFILFLLLFIASAFAMQDPNETIKPSLQEIAEIKSDLPYTLMKKTIDEIRESLDKVGVNVRYNRFI